MGTATARVLSGVYPAWMAMVSSRMGSVAPVGSRQPVGVQPLRHVTPRPGRSLGGPVEVEPLDERRVPLALFQGPLDRREALPVPPAGAGQRQAGDAVALAPDVAAHVAPVLGEQAPGLVFGVALDEHHPAAPDGLAHQA